MLVAFGLIMVARNSKKEDDEAEKEEIKNNLNEKLIPTIVNF